MACFGFYAQEHRGGIYRRSTGNGVPCISGSADGVTRGSGKNCWKFWLMSPILEWLMIDASHCKVHPHAAGARGGNQDMSRTKGGSIPRFTLPWMPNGMPVRVLITEGTRADCKEAIHLIDGISAETLLADRGYDTNQIIAYAADAGMNIVIPAKRNRKQQREYDRYLYRLRHLVENAFLHLKRWRGIATRYAKTTTSFLAAVQIRCIAIWCTVLT